MKSTAIILTTFALAASAFAQGNVVFSTRVTAAGLVAPVYGPSLLNPGERLSGQATTNGGTVDYTGVRTLVIGTGFTAALWGSSAGNPSQELGRTTFRTTAISGHVQQPLNDISVPFVTSANAPLPVTFQLRVWNNNGGLVTSWADALARPDLAQGASDDFTIALGFGPPLGSAPSANLIGLKSFNLTIVPEPGVIALGVLGLGALLLRRRK